MSEDTIIFRQRQQKRFQSVKMRKLLHADGSTLIVLASIGICFYIQQEFEGGVR